MLFVLVSPINPSWAGKKRDTVSAKHQFSGDREGVRRQSVATALQGLMEYLNA
jgi:nicotinamide mononucleotide (NMN) deamidase PncC